MTLTSKQMEAEQNFYRVLHEYGTTLRALIDERNGYREALEKIDSTRTQPVTPETKIVSIYNLVTKALAIPKTSKTSKTK